MKEDEDIKILEEFIEEYRIAEEVLDGDVIQAIQNLIARYKELRTHYEIICDDLEEHNLIYTDTPEFEDNYIPKSKVQEKIEELDKLIKEAQTELGSASKEFTIYVYQKDILKSILED